jgi:hypothetical protein
MVLLADCPVEAPTDVMGISAPVAASKPTPATSADVRTRPFGIRNLLMPAVLQKSPGFSNRELASSCQTFGV